MIPQSKLFIRYIVLVDRICIFVKQLSCADAIKSTFLKKYIVQHVVPEWFCSMQWQGGVTALYLPCRRIFNSAEILVLHSWVMNNELIMIVLSFYSYQDMRVFCWATSTMLVVCLFPPLFLFGFWFFMNMYIVCTYSYCPHKYKYIVHDVTQTTLCYWFLEKYIRPFQLIQGLDKISDISLGKAWSWCILNILLDGRGDKLILLYLKTIFFGKVSFFIWSRAQRKMFFLIFKLADCQW